MKLCSVAVWIRAEPFLAQFALQSQFWFLEPIYDLLNCACHAEATLCSQFWHLPAQFVYFRAHLGFLDPLLERVGSFWSEFVPLEQIFRVWIQIGLCSHFR